MVNQDAILVEYTSLRQELIQRLQLSLQASTITFPIAASVMTYAFQIKSSIDFLVVSGLLLFILGFITYETGYIRSIGAYIYVIIEPKIEGLQWESLMKLKRKNKNLEEGDYATILTGIMIEALTLTCILLALTFLQNQKNVTLPVYGVMYLLIVSHVIMSFIMYHVVSQKYYEKLMKEWKSYETKLSVNKKSDK